MPLHVHSLIRAVALCVEMAIHAGIFSLIAVAMFAQKAGAYGALQFSMDVMVMFVIVGFMFFKHMHEDVEPSRVPNITCFSIILSLSLTGATGLAIRATSGNGFCEEFLSARPEECKEAGLAIAMSWVSVFVAIAGILVSWLDKYPGAVEVTKLYVPQRSARGIELLRQRSTSNPMNVPPHIRIPRPPTPYPASRTRDSHHIQDPAQPVQARTFPRHEQRLPSHRVPSSLPSPLLGGTSGPAPLMLRRQIHGPVGQAPRDRSIFVRVDDLQDFPGNVDPTKRNTRELDERNVWKNKFLGDELGPF